MLLVLLVLSPTGNQVFGEEKVRVVILPFEIYSSEKVEYLKDVITNELGELLERRPTFQVVRPHMIADLLPREASTGSLNRTERETLMQKTEAHFVICGSVTKIESNVSLDARV